MKTEKLTLALDALNHAQHALMLHTALPVRKVTSTSHLRRHVQTATNLALFVLTTQILSAQDVMMGISCNSTLLPVFHLVLQVILRIKLRISVVYAIQRAQSVQDVPTPNAQNVTPDISL